MLGCIGAYSTYRGTVLYCTILENLVLRLGQEIVRISHQTNANSREEAYLGR